MSTLTTLRNLKDHINTIKVEWWISDFWQDMKNGKCYYSEPFPKDNSITEKFRLQAEVAGYDSYLIHVYFCVWDAEFDSTDIQIPSEVSLFYPKFKDISSGASSLELPWVNVATPGTEQKLQITEAYDWYLIYSYSLADSTNTRALNNLYIRLNFEYQEVTNPAQRLTRTLSVCDFSKLYEDETYADITVEAADGVKKGAHKVVLVCRSKVFHAMFNHQMAETNTATVQIEDINGETLEIFLKYLYTGTLPTNLELRDGKAMLSLADKYEISTLKIIAQEQLYKLLSKDNVIEVLIHSNLHNAEPLKKLTMYFVKEIGIEILTKTEGWEKLNNEPNISTHLLEFLHA